MLFQPTGGVLCCAKTRPSLAALGVSFAAHDVTKRYRAIVVGLMLQGHGRITTPLVVSDHKGYVSSSFTLAAHSLTRVSA